MSAYINKARFAARLVRALEDAAPDIKRRLRIASFDPRKPADLARAWSLCFDETISDTTAENWLGARYLPNPANMRRLAQLTGKSVEWLVGQSADREEQHAYPEAAQVPAPYEAGTFADRERQRKAAVKELLIRALRELGD
ncbi:hypothetical protein [Caballeronia catudaia]|nr:hypothetical protein [Caballeronia catudaia]